MRFFSCLFVVFIVACGGKLGRDPNEIDLDAAPEGGRVPRLPDGGALADAKCGDVAQPPIVSECDVLRPTQTCPSGLACYPVIVPPDGPCETEQYGSRCITPGTGKQGAPCGGGTTTRCAPGYICVITGGTTECAKACQLGAKNQCDDGYICEPIDVPGYAVCL